MARPPKKTLDFFMHDSGARGDRKIKGLRRRHGNDGYATYFILLEMICQEEGMRLSLADSLDTETAIEETGTRDQAHLHAIVQTCADIGLFDKQLWESERIVFSHGLFKRYKSRLEERKADAARKQRKREEQSLQARIDEISQSEDPKPDPKSKPDPYPDPKHPELSDSFPPGQLPGVNEGKGLQVVPRRVVDVMAAQFMPKPWRDGQGIDEKFCIYLGEKMPVRKGEPNDPKWKGRRAIINAEKSNDPLELEKFQLDWQDYQSESQKKAATAAPPIAIDTSQMSPDEYRAYIDRRRAELIGGGAA